MLCRRSPLLAILSVSALTLTACASSPGNLSVDLQAIRKCQSLGGARSVSEITADSDYRDVSAEALTALKQANRGSAARTTCENKVIDEYAKATSE